MLLSHGSVKIDILQSSFHSFKVHSCTYLHKGFFACFLPNSIPRLYVILCFVQLRNTFPYLGGKYTFKVPSIICAKKSTKKSAFLCLKHFAFYDFLFSILGIQHITEGCILHCNISHVDVFEHYLFFLD